MEAIQAGLVVSDGTFRVVAAEKRVRQHDIMSRFLALPKDVPDAVGTTHIEVTSCYGASIIPRFLRAFNHCYSCLFCITLLH